MLAAPLAEVVAVLAVRARGVVLLPVLPVPVPVALCAAVHLVVLPRVLALRAAVLLVVRAAEALVVVLLLSRQWFSAAMARTTP
jgi:hypothetical protein